VEPESPLRQAAILLLECAIRIAPEDTRDWGQAIRGELDYVEGRFAALRWSLGGAGVLARHAVAALFMPGRHDVPLGEGLFARNVSLRKVALVMSAAFVLASLIFFAAPPFRQGLRVSLAAWDELIDANAARSQARLERLAERAHVRADPEGLAFAAVRLDDEGEAARSAEDAVRLDPGFVWVYAAVAARHPELAASRAWIPQLEKSDPENALPYLIAAESIDIANAALGAPLVGAQHGAATRAAPASGAWQNAMASAFASPKFDDYLGRLAELDRDVVPRYGFDDPYTVLSAEGAFLLWDWGAGVPSYAVANSRQFAKSLLDSGQELESRGERGRAVEKYWTVARFGQVIDSQAHTDFERRCGMTLQAMAYQRLQALSAKQGDEGEAALFGYLVGKFGSAASMDKSSEGARLFGLETSRRNALVLQISSLTALVCCALVLAALLIVLVAGRVLALGARASRPGVAPAALRARSRATALAVAGAFGMFLSSASIYLTYRPYWYIFQRAILKGDRSQLRDLGDFLVATQMTLSGTTPGSVRYLKVPVYFWAAVILLAIIGLILILMRHLRSRPRIDAPRHSAHAP